MNGFDLSTISDCYIGSTQVSAIYLGSNLVWPYSTTYGYLTFQSLNNGTQISFSINNLDYSLDSGNTWNILTPNDSITLGIGDTVMFKAHGLTPTQYEGIGTFSVTNGYVNVSGNIMSLVGGRNFGNLTTISNPFQFKYLFYECTNIIDASNLVLPATTLAGWDYQYMFEGCTSLTSAPALPATTLNFSCYESMFSECTSLTSAPALPATTLSDRCYTAMFAWCTSLTSAPTLPATTLATQCYNGMFSYCTSLTSAPALPATTLASYCYNGTFVGCSSLTSAPTLPATTLVEGCYSQMFSDCTSLTSAPALPVTTLAQNCYQGMFNGCTSLTTAPELPATTLANDCYYRMFYGCTSLNSIICLATDISAQDCTTEWTYNIAASGTFTKAASMSNWTTGVNGIPSGWTVQNYGPAPHDYSQDYFTIVSLDDNNAISLTANDSSIIKTVSISTNNGVSWSTMTSTTSGATFATLNTGDKMLIKGSNAAYADASYWNKFTSTGRINVEGNIMSLINGSSFANRYTISTLRAFRRLFVDNQNLISAENLILPATTLSTYCYELMFGGCTSLTTAPVLPATTVKSYSYSQMFDGCTSLNYIKCLATDISAFYSTYRWLANVAASGTFVKAASMSSWSTGNAGIPSGWTVQDAS